LMPMTGLTQPIWKRRWRSSIRIRR
jgi:hypothetical protein